ncbi:MAG: PorT family protein [Bacteroidaceae bacterium]|nr:PorT family protein [Bacteroidaceae bacterium]
MKRFLTIALAALFAGNMMALENVPKTGFTWQAFAGFNVTNMVNIGQVAGNGSYDSKVGANFGVRTDYVLPNAYGIYMSTGVDWTQKGAKKTFANKDKNIVQAHYLEIPIHVGYRYNISKKVGVYGDVGPYFAVGVTGKDRYKPFDDKDPNTHTMTFGKKDYPEWNQETNSFVNHKIRAIQRFDCGIGFRVGAEYNNQYSINLGWDWGFTDAWLDDFRMNYANNEYNGKGIENARLGELKNHSFTLTLGYRF